jgi:uncharacterized membrane protein
LQRFPFLDWTRGLAVLLMIVCHVFNSFTRMDARQSGPYVLSQFVGGMAAPLFLFMAGMTLGFGMESLERRGIAPAARWRASLRRAAYVLGIAFLFRLTNWAGSLPHADLGEITKVDILNCMGVGMVVFASAALFRGAARARFAVALALGIAAAAPLMSNLPWDGAPALLREYLVPGPGRGRFPFFPWASYIGFGVTVGVRVKRVAAERMDRLMEWLALAGFGLVFISQYFSNIPYSLYPKSDFWQNSPALVLIRVGIMLLTLVGAYLWTAFCAPAGWSWMQCLGRNSLMVYWIHVMLVYGGIAQPIKRTLSVGGSAIALVLMTGLMLAMSAAWLWWKAKRASRVKRVIAA